MDISINYKRKDHQIRLLQKGINLIEEYYGDFNYVKIGVDQSKKILRQAKGLQNTPFRVGVKEEI